jgi:hypothetical protein
MNWVLSEKSLRKIEEDIKEKWANRDKGKLQKFLAIDTNYCILCGKRKKKGQ